MREVNVGDTLDQYELTELIARSGMASIFKAVDRTNGQTFAIKIPYEQFENDVIFRSRFQREEEIVRRLDHPNIIKDFTPRHKSRMYIAMEYVEGVSVREELAAEGAFSRDHAIDYARQICGALVYMHEQRVIHRDLKPENLLITTTGVVKIMDFGIALDELARRITWSGESSTIGTPDYMAPEQIAGGRGDVRSDIYALGIILYEMLTGKLPYEGDSVYSILRAKTLEDPEPPTHYLHELDTHLEEIILHAIERVPRRRYGRVAEMQHDLKNAAQVAITGRASALHPRSRRSQKVRAVMWSAVLFLSMAMVVAFLIWLENPYSPPAPPPMQGPSGDPIR